MRQISRPLPAFVAIGFSLVIAACGGGSSDSDVGIANNAVDTPANGNQPVVQESGAPAATGDTSTDGFNWTNFRRSQLGLTALTHNSAIDRAAQNHSDYQRANDVITHEETRGFSGFTGETVQERLVAAGYGLRGDYAFGEVISASGDTSGFNAAEDLIAAIYHRFVMFQPSFREAGAGTATVPDGYTYFTLNLASTNGLAAGLGSRRIVAYPFDGQTNVPTIFYSDYESPDPVEDRNEVGYPISVHADITSDVTVQTFTVAPRGAAALPVKLLSSTTDTHTTPSAAAIVPLVVLSPNTTYDVQFTGLVDGVAVSRSWSFTTR
ncbi:cysteine-rich secretory family protein [Paucimonas lemoignei]|uniref:Cysteine-rich secretory family protein n=1 Tax=Paucimonas lemoignei TaxID=29443 RepID=A0A4R3HXB6_PAULE|nr:CAP domain-containing protein [Paucimonas lemoignei]TCS37967.1 cysteine-rich secretory family protein [Paucimonas lemoignei]